MSPKNALPIMLLSAGLLVACSSTPTREEAAVAESVQRAAEVNVELGQGYMQRGDNKIALEKLQKALELDPNSAAAHTVIAVLYERLDLSDKAEEHFRRSTELAPEDGITLNNFATFLCRRQKFAEADAMFQRALKDPFYKTPAALLGNAGICAMQAGDRVKAEAYFRRALQINAKQPQSLFQLAQIELSSGNALSARAFIQRYEAAAPVSPEMLELRTRVETALGDAETAEKYRNRLRTEFPDYQPTTSGGTESR